MVFGSTACSIVTQVEDLTREDLPEIGGYRVLRRLADLLSDADIRWWPPDEGNQAKSRRVATTYAVRQ